LSFGNPPAGPTILEALFYKKVLFGPSEQYPESTHNPNIYFTNNLNNEQIYELIVNNCNFKENEMVDELLKSENFNRRINNIFGL
jgi:hypothetical protein